MLVENAEQNLRLFGTLQNSEAEVYTLQVGDKIYDLKNRYNNSNYILGDIFRLCFDLHFYSIYTCNVDDDEKLEYVILPDYAWGYNDAFIIDIDNNDKAMVYNYSYNLWENCGQIDQEYPRYSDYEIRDPQEYYVGEDNQLHFRFTFVNKNNPIEIMKYWGGTVRFEALEDDYCTFIVSATGEEPVFTDKEKQILKEDVLNENRCDNVYKLAKEMQKDVYLYGAQKDEQCYSILRMGEHAYALDFDWKQYKDIQIYTNDYDEDGCMEVAMDCFKEPYGLGGEELYVVELKENATEIYKCPSVTIGQLSESANKCSKEGLLVTDEYNRFAANGTFLEFFFYMNVDMNCRTEMHSSGTYIGEIKYHEDGSFEYIERPNGDVLMLLYG